jgi:hypothetical protein
VSRKWLILTVLTAVITVCGVSYFYIFHQPNSEATAHAEARMIPSDHPDPEMMQEEADFLVTLQYGEYEEEIVYQDGQENKVKAIISAQHSYLNTLAGWGRAEDLNVAATMHTKEWKKLRADIKWLHDEGLADSRIKNDMKNARAFMYVAETGDSMSLRYLHRIFHDLDATLNGAEVEKIWGVTHAFGTSSKQRTLHKYLQGN